jgi:hypothetical protein
MINPSEWGKTNTLPCKKGLLTNPNKTLSGFIEKKPFLKEIY